MLVDAPLEPDIRTVGLWVGVCAVGKLLAQLRLLPLRWTQLPWLLEAKRMLVDVILEPDIRTVGLWVDACAVGKLLAHLLKPIVLR
jgi:hypothetical protein